MRTTATGTTLKTALIHYQNAAWGLPCQGPQLPWLAYVPAIPHATTHLVSKTRHATAACSRACWKGRHWSTAGPPS